MDEHMMADEAYDVRGFADDGEMWGDDEWPDDSWEE